jgi:hypothetical protein
MNVNNEYPKINNGNNRIKKQIDIIFNKREYGNSDESKILRIIAVPLDLRLRRT